MITKERLAIMKTQAEMIIKGKNFDNILLESFRQDVLDLVAEVERRKAERQQILSGLANSHYEKEGLQCKLAAIREAAERVVYTRHKRFYSHVVLESEIDVLAETIKG